MIVQMGVQNRKDTTVSCHYKTVTKQTRQGHLHSFKLKVRSFNKVYLTSSSNNTFLSPPDFRGFRTQIPYSLVTFCLQLHQLYTS